MKLMECVPNFSEGRDMAVLDAIAAAIKGVKNVVLLDVDPGADTNRTVFTIAGEPEAVVEAAFQGIKKASELIDMSRHHGAHPRMGATDVCPFIPHLRYDDGRMRGICPSFRQKSGRRAEDPCISL
ncbi:MAG: hypothetical protein LRZ88_00330 [Candidatus Cloacimonetes bacterium]|nr:hypothetical protein [Candidatus Cloacimonadota bacterium]